MEKFEKILELLEKKSLTESEKQLIEEFSESDEEIRSLLKIYNSLNSGYSSANHIHTDILSSYILYESGDEPENRIIPLIREKIKLHIDECEVCSEEYHFLKAEYENIREHVKQSVEADDKVPQEIGRIARPGFFINQSSFRYAFTTFIILVFGYFAMYIVSSSVTPDYKKNIFSVEQDDFHKTRGRTSLLFQQGLNSISEGDFELAIKYLEEDIRDHQNEKSIFYSYYIIGITYIKFAESDFIGLFKSYDFNKVDLAIKNLKESINRNNSGDYENLVLDSYYYIGRAYLLMDDIESAKLNLQKVIIGKGRYTNESRTLLSKLEKN